MFVGCNEEPIGQYAVDGVAPGFVTNTSVENFKGYSEITYTIPSDKDLSYVAAFYTDSKGENRETRASAFSNKLIVNGFAKSEEIEVKLVAVDKSDNFSSGVPVKIKPFDSPIFDVYNTLNIEEAFGGIKLSWDNPDKFGIVVEVNGEDSTGVMVPLENFYSSAENGSGAVRGLNSEARNFGVVIRDQYYNTTDTLKKELIPLFEELLNKDLCQEMPFSKKFTQSPWGGLMTCVWDNVGYNPHGYNSFDLFGNGEDSIYFTYDLGVTAKLSRFKMWSRGDQLYKLAHPRHFQIWVTTDPEIAKNTDSFDGWQMVFEVKTEKVSGNDEYGAITAEDLEHAKAGEEFEMGLPAPTARFIRFRTLETWGHMDRSWVSELSWWGEVIDEQN